MKAPRSRRHSSRSLCFTGRTRGGAQSACEPSRVDGERRRAPRGRCCWRSASRIGAASRARAPRCSWFLACSARRRCCSFSLSRCSRALPHEGRRRAPARGRARRAPVERCDGGGARGPPRVSRYARQQRSVRRALRHRHRRHPRVRAARASNRDCWDGRRQPGRARASCGSHSAQSNPKPDHRPREARPTVALSFARTASRSRRIADRVD